MKKVLFLSLSLLASTCAFAQPSVTNAFNANKEGDFEAAAGFIETAITDPKASTKEKTWRYRGDIYLNIASDAALLSKYPNAIQLSKESYFKNLELDKYGDYKVEVTGSLGKLQMLVSAMTDQQLKDDNYCGAADNFITISDISGKFAIVDSASLFNAGLCYDKCGNNTKALESYKRCADIGYNIPDVFRYMSEVYLKDGKKEEARKVISDARAKYPKDAELLRTEVNIYLADEQYEKAETLLKSLTEADPKNEVIHYILGITYGKLAKKDEEEAAYKSALALKPNYYDALFNSGAMYFNRGLDKEKECETIPPRETAKFNDCTASCKVSFANAVTNLEGAYNNMAPEMKGTQEERQLIGALKDAYYKAERYDDYNKMKELLGK
jgi:tetratricopeptide (TPR) repeat protein